MVLIMNMTSVVSGSLENVTNQILNEVRELEKGEENHRYTHHDKIYKNNDNKIGNKKFVARQPKITKEKRNKIKELIKEYLKIKFSDENNLKIETTPNRNKKKNVFRFKIKTDDSSFWYELSQERHNGYSTLSFVKDHKKTIALLTDKEELIFQKGILTRIFRGNQLENIVSCQREKKPDSFWSGWKTSMGASSEILAYLPSSLQNGIYNICELFSSTSPPWDQYQTMIHPALKEASLEILKSYSDLCPNVVEICGGGGELAVEIVRHYSNPLKYYLLEYNDMSLQRARTHISNTFIREKNRSKIIPIKTDVTNPHDYFLDDEKQEPMENGSIDLIIGSGALTVYVLENKKAARKVAEKCYGLLKLNGKMILAGHAHSLLNSEDFAMLGFNVINSFLVGVQNESFSTEVNHWIVSLGGFNQQFYILEKLES
jgi:hypothetical protein